MTIAALLAGVVRLAAIIVPVAFVARRICRSYVAAAGPLGWLCEAIVALSVVIVGTEFLGVLGLDRSAWLIALFLILAASAYRVTEHHGANPGLVPDAVGLDVGPPRRWEKLSMMVALVMVCTEWLVQTANSLGAGMTRFDTLWYHMPFAAQFAQTGSVSGIPFTQADPFTTYYPANSELLHAIGIIALHSDLASPLINLLWLAIALLAGWCFGRPWRIERLTVIATCLLLAVPVIGATQPGQAFNDIAGLAALLAAVALLVNFPQARAMLVVCGLALGLAVGTKLTFIVPAAVIVIGICANTVRRDRVRTAGWLLGPLLVSSGWWYLRNLIATGSPLGLQVKLGPIRLPGATSALATAAQQTVFSELGHPHFLTSRFIPGLDSGLGPLWAVILLVSIGGAFAATALPGAPMVRVIAVTAILSGISYLFAPTGATSLAGSSALFSENLRYAMPALLLGALLAPVLHAQHAPGARLRLLGPLLAIVVVVTQIQHSLWLTQPARHLAFTAGLLAILAVAALVRRARSPGRSVRWELAIVALLAAGGGLVIVQRHYFDQRYRLGVQSDPGLSAIYRWSQNIAHARIALYGTVEQYPFYGAFDTNRVTYLGMHTADGGYIPIDTCSRWRVAITSGYQYLILTGAPTAGLPISWTTGDPSLALALHPSASDYVFRVTSSAAPPC
ncbi:MAG TPA: hypothetical protein VLP43_05120 [Solirubrobacteraceae bacterium]|nr:hypothetical protein [Solirubrobacteraceae bacterium]